MRRLNQDGIIQFIVILMHVTTQLFRSVDEVKQVHDLVDFFFELLLFLWLEESGGVVRHEQVILTVGGFQIDLQILGIFLLE